jgi:hypothetical protein
MPPRHTKSEFASFFLPAWMIGNSPKLKIIQATHTAELAVSFGRKAKHLIDSEDYREIFNTRLQEDSKAAGRWDTDHGGEYFAVGVQGAVTGRGADLLIIDDPHSEQDVYSPTAFDKAYEWYTSGPRQRFQPGGLIVLVMTRWSTKDLTAQLVKAQAAEEKADQWEVVDFLRSYLVANLSGLNIGSSRIYLLSRLQQVLRSGMLSTCKIQQVKKDL